MGNKFQNWLKGAVATCSDVNRISSNPSKLKELSLAKRLKLKLHRSICIWCRRYAKQTIVLKDAMEKHQQKSAEGTLSEVKMSEEAKDRLKKALRDLAK